MGKKKNIAFSGLGLCFVTYVYFAYFYINDPDEVLRANQQLYQERQTQHLYNVHPSQAWTSSLPTTTRYVGHKNQTSSNNSQCATCIKTSISPNSTEEKQAVVKSATKKKYLTKAKTLVTFPEYPNASYAEIQQKQNALWRSWLADKGYISVGEYFNHCGNNRIVIGQFVIVHDQGDIKFKTFINTTWTRTVATGTIHVHVSYAGIPIIKLAQDICRSTRKAFKCPLQVGFNTMTIDFKLPFFIPKGRYHMQAWGQNKQGYVLACLIADVII